VITRALAWVTSFGIGLLLLGVGVGVARRTRGRRVEAAAAWLEGAVTWPWLPAACGVVTAGIVWYCWDSLNPIPTYHDERAYLLQAQIFARGLWVAPPPPLPRFFEQFHVLVDPVVAAKYPPGHSLALVPGIWLGMTGLIPIALGGLTGALVVATVRRVAQPWIALLTWAIWISEPANLRWHASFMSETTTTALWLLAWWLLLQWRTRHEDRWLVALGLCLGAGAITRPLTMLVFALPVAVVVARDAMRRRRWRDILVPLGATGAVLLVLPVWCERTTGQWTETPLHRYTEDYIPWDHPGLGFDSTPPRRALPPDLQVVVDEFAPIYRAHTLENIPRIAAERVAFIGGEFVAGWRRVLLVVVVIGVLDLSGAVTIPVLTAGLLLVAYLSYPHFPNWTVYYLETLPVLALLAARGLWRVVCTLAAARPGLASAVLLLGASPWAIAGIRRVSADRREYIGYSVTFRDKLATLGDGQALVIVRYPPGPIAHRSIVGNTADPSAARIWVAYDLGPDDSALIARAPGRRAYLYDDGRRSLTALPRDAVTTGGRDTVAARMR
jgi:hypothetical protein